jgi:TP901 family phage tail tape measure protein
MADANANIRIDVDTSAALSQIKELQRQISVFHSRMAQSGKAAAAESAKMQANLINSINATKGFSAGMTSIRTSTESFTNSLEKNKFSMGEYFRYAGASTKTFGKLFKSEFNTINKVARERVKDLQTQYIKLGRDASGSMKAIKIRPTTLDMQNLGTQTAIAAQKQQLFNQLMKQGSTNLLNFGKNTQWAGRQLMVGFTIPLTIMGATAAREFMKLEEQAIKFKRVYGDMFTTGKQTDEALANIRELASEFTKFGVAIEDTIGLAASVAQMGAMGADLTNQVTQATRLAVLGGIEQQEALDTTISLTNAFGLATDQLAGKIAFLNAAENQTILSIEDFNEAIPKAGSVVKQLGGDVEDLAYFLTAMREGGINASQSANALKSSLARLINPTEVAQEKLAGFGIDILGIVNDNAGNLKETIQVLAVELDKLDPLDKARAIEQLFGKFQFARMSTLFENIVKDGSQANKVLALTTNSAEELAIIADRELARVSDSPMFKFKKSLEEFQAALAPIGKAFLELATPLIEFGNRVLDQFNNMSEGSKKFVTGVVAIAGVVAPALIMVIGLLANGLANAIKFGMLVRNALTGAAQSSDVLTNQYQYMNSEQIEAAAVASSLDQVHAKLRQTFTSEAAAVAKLTAAYDRAIVKQNQMAASGAAFGGKKGAAPKKYNSGVVSVPGPKGKGDIVPAMLTPGEAVIPAEMAKKYAPLIQSMISDSIPGFNDGVDNLMSDPGTSRRAPISASVRQLDKVDSQAGTRAVQMLGQIKTSRTEARRVMSSFVELSKQGSEALRMGFQNLQQSIDDGMRGGDLTKSFRAKTGTGQAKGSDNAFAHIGAGSQMTREELIAAAESGEMKMGKKKLENIRNLPGGMSVPVKSGLGMGGFNQEVNRQLDRGGATVKDFSKAFDKAGVQKWTKSVEFAGGNTKELSADIEILDNEFKRLIKESKATKMFDTEDQRKEYDAQMKAAGRSDRGESVQRVYGKAKKKVAGTELERTLDTAAGTVTEVRDTGTSPGNARRPMGNSKALQKQAEKEGIAVAKSFLKGRKKGLKGKDPYLEGRTRKSPHPQAAKDGKDDAKAYNKARSAAAKKGWETRRRNQQMASESAAGSVGSGARRLSAGKLAGIGGAASTAMFAASMAPGQVGEAASKLMMPMMALSALLPMLTNPLGIAVVALGALGGATFAAVSSMNKARDEAMELANALGSGSDAIQKLAEASGNVSAGEIMDKRRASQGQMFETAPGESTFGETFMEGDAGTELLENVKKAMSSGGMDQVNRMVTNQMATAIASGALDPGQARSIVAELSEEIGNYGMGIDINSKLIDLIGPNGENLLTDPLGIRLQILGDGQELIDSIGGNLESSIGGVIQSGTVTGLTTAMGAVGGGKALKTPIRKMGISMARSAFKPFVKIGTRMAAASVAGPIGTVVGGVVGLATAGFDLSKAWNQASASAGAMTAGAVIALQQGQEMLDSLELQYEQRKLAAEAAGDAAEATRLETEYLENRKALLAVGAQATEGLRSGFEGAGFFGKNRLNSAADKGLKDLYKDNPLQQMILDDTVNQLKKATSGADEYQLKLMLMSKDLSPQELSSFLTRFGEDKATIDTFLKVSTKLTNAEGSRALQIMNMFEDQERQAKFLADINTDVPEEADRYLTMFQELSKVGNVVNPQILFSFYQDNPEAAKKLMEDIDKVKEIAAEGPQELIAYQTVLGEEEMEALLKYNEDFNKLSATQQITYIQTFKTIYATEGTPGFQQDKGAYEAEVGESLTNTEYAAAQANTRVGAAAGMQAPEPPKTPSTTSGSGSGPKASVFDDLTKSLRNTRNATIDAEKGWKKATGALDDLFDGGKKNLKVFDGLANQLRGVGASESMIEKIVGMDPDEYEKRKDELFNFDADGRITSVTNKFKSLQSAINADELGKYVNTQQSFVANTKNQFTAMNKLTAEGMSFVDAYKLVQDQALATAVAMSASTEEMEELIRVTEMMNDMQEKMNRENEKSSAAEAVKRTNKEFEERYKALAKISKEQGKMSDAQITEILSDPNLAKLYLNPSIDPATLKKRLKQAEARANLELNLKVATEEGKEALFDELMGDVNDRFSMLEEEIEIDFKLATEGDNDIVRDAQKKIADIQYEIDDYQAELKGIADQEEEINDKYDKRYEALEKVATAQESIARAQQAQLTIADALSRGDIAAAARAQQELRDQEAEASREERRAQLERAQQAELGNLRSKSGKSRTELEDAIKAKQDEIFNIEEETLEPAQDRIRLAEYQKEVAIDNLEIAGKTRDEWAKMASEVDLATFSLDEFKNKLLQIQALYDYFLNGTPLDGSLFGEKELQDLIDSGQVDAGDVYEPPEVTEEEDPEDTLGPAIVSAIEEGKEVDESQLTERQRAAKNLYEVNRLGKEGALATIQKQLSDPKSANKVATRIAKEAGIIGQDGSFNMSADAAERAMKKAIEKEAVAMQRKRDQIASLNYAKKVGTTNPDRLDAAYGKDIASIGKSTNIGKSITQQVASNYQASRDAKQARTVIPPKPVYKTPTPKKTYTPYSAPKPTPKKVYTPPKKTTTQVVAQRKAVAASTAKYKASGMSLRAYMRNSGGSIPGYSIGGNVKGYSVGGFASMGTDTVPAMLTPGEFVIRRPAVQSIGLENLEKLNKTGTYNDGSVYNYNLAVNVTSDADPNKIANVVMREIRRVESQRVRGNRI